MIAVVNVSKNWAIGKKGGLLVSIPEDMKHFRETTRGGVCIMGRATLASFPNGAPLKGRVNIVLTRDPNSIPASAFEAAADDRARGKATELITAESPEAAAVAARKYPERGIPFVIGGESVYRAMLSLCGTCIVTRNDLDDPGADTFFPDLEAMGGWSLVSEGEERVWEGIHYRICRYERAPGGTEA